ncbi:MAG: alpha/beta fold hydrolase [Vicinamibacterales bacterium]
MDGGPLLHVGWYELHPDANLNFQLNRRAAFGGPAWVEDVRPVLPALRGYDEWRSIFVSLGESALSQGRTRHAALHFRCAEYVMAASDARREALRQRLLALFRQGYGIPESSRREVPFGDVQLPTWHFPAASPKTAVVFGGIDTYVEELFPLLLYLNREGWRVVAFEGPGQGSVLEEQYAPMSTDWHLPVRAVLDAYDLNDVTLIGVSFGGCLAIRAAAFEPRVTRVVAFNAMTDLLECIARDQPVRVAAALRGLLAVGARRAIDDSASTLAQHSQAVEQALSQAMHVFGSATPSEALEKAKAFQTRDVSARVRQDVLLMAGADDHYIPLEQLWEQGRLLTGARSITARVFTAGDLAQAHCQIGNLPLALHVISSWADRPKRA